MLMGHPPLMMRAADRPLPEPLPGLRIVRVEDAETDADLERTLIDGYPAPMLAPVDPSKPATLVASDLGRPIYEQLGFVAIGRVSYWVGMR